MAGLGGAMQCLKYMLFLLNFMFLLLGVLLITIGAAILINYNDFEFFLDSAHFKPAEIIIACGAIMVFISLIGCIGAVKESTAMVNIFALLLFLLMIMEIGGAITAFAMHCDIYLDVENNMKSVLEDYKISDSARKAWDYTQENLQCCGVHHPRDWQLEHVDGPVVNISGSIFTVPYSCCDDKDECLVYARGCLDILSSYVSDSILLLVYIGAGVGATQLISVIFACSLAGGIRRAKTQQEIERQQNRQRIFEEAVSRNGRGRTSPFFPIPTSTDA